MSYTKELVDWAVDVKYEDIPKEAVDLAKLHVLDTIGCALGGSVTTLGKTVIKMVEDSGTSKSGSTVIGDGRRTISKDAAFINATLANALDYGDGGGGHPSSTIVHSALSIGEKVGSSGKDFLEAIVPAYDVLIRVSKYMRRSQENYQQVWGVGDKQAFGGVIAAGKLLNLNRLQMLNAFGYAGAASPLPSAMKWGFDIRPGLSWVKDSVGQAALAGVMGAELARHGFLGCRNILDGETGFWRMTGCSGRNFEALTKNLGKEWLLIKGLAIKPYSSCRFTHPSLDAMLQIIKEHKISAKDIKHVTVKSIWDLTELFQDYAPKEIVDAEFSMPYTMAMVILGIHPGPGWYTEEMLHNPEALELAKKVTTLTDPEAEKKRREAENPRMVSTVDVTTVDGREISVYIDQLKGSSKNPMTPDEIKEKFRHLASWVLDDTKIEKIVDIADNLEKLDNINNLTKLLS